MASRKRTQPYDTDDEAEPASSHSGGAESPAAESSARKRRRTSDDPSVHQEVTSDSEIDATASTPPSEYDNDDEERERIATQALHQKHAEDRNKTNEPAESGILERVELTNFMCHDDMKYDLGPLINFICGKNGSGKSAILTAITLCLGGKASATNRGGRLQDFIKQGKEYATIVCKIKNHGEGAYMPEEYGNTIQVERHFSKNGSSGFKLKSERGRIISTKRSDLDDVCDHFALQMDNPMNVLSQDQARQFITASSSADKYKLFVKGVQLEQLDQDYRLIEEQVDNIAAKIEAKRPDIKILEQRMERAKQKLALTQRHDGIREKLRDYRRQLAWAQVELQENIRDKYAAEIDIAQTKIAETEEQVVGLDQIFQTADRQASEANEAYEAAQADVQTAEDDKKEEKAKAEEAKKETIDAQAEQRTIRTALKNAEEKIQTKRQEIALEQQRLAEIDGGGAARRRAQLEDARTNVQQAARKLQDHRNTKSGLEKDAAAARQQTEKLDIDRAAKTTEVDQQAKNLHAIRQRGEAQDLAYHANMAKLLKAIQHETRFQQRPVGPIGKHIQLLKPEWSSILERTFGSLLNGFIVTSKRDEVLLSDIMKKTQCFVPVSIGNDQPIDTTPHEPDREYDTILRILKIDNDAVKKQLVIQNAIEQSILIPDLQEASRIMYQSGAPIRNVKRCFCFSASSRRQGTVLFYRGGRAAQDPVHAYPGKPRMKTDNEAQVRFAQEALDASKEQLQQTEDDYRTSRDTGVKAQQALNRYDKQERELRVAHQKAEDHVEGLIEAIKEDNVEGGRLEVLRTALAEAEGDKGLNEEAFMDSQNAFDRKKQRLRECQQVLTDLDKGIAELQDTVRQAQAHAQQLSKKRAHALGEKNAACGRIDDAKEDKASLERKKTDMDNKISEWIEQARQVCERVNINPGETHESLEKKYKKLTADLDKYQRQIGGSREQIVADALRTAEAFENGRRDLQHLESLGEKLKYSLVERRKRWEMFRSLISVRAKTQFTYLLSERGFRGHLLCDHQQKLLEIFIEPDITKKDGSGRGAKTLSGGEKSFSQLCLLLAIWEAMGSPIRCLDEFDVYMDAVNRRLSVNLLIDGARQSRGKQFILISPGTKNDITTAQDVRAIEIEPPLRGGQTRLVLAAA